MNSNRSFPSTSMATMLFVLSATVGSGQTGTSAIRGQVLDSQSRAVPNARVTIADEDSKLLRTQVTGELGEFAFVGLPPRSTGWIAKLRDSRSWRLNT
jgi:protocatechuate 3,4-dioxygenase beta subunit